MQELKDFKNIHKDKTIVVCGCGESLNSFIDQDKCISIGVNDVGRQFDPNYLVVVNPREQFTEERFSYIERSKSDYIFSQYTFPFKNLIKIEFGGYGGTDFSNPNILHYTKHSTYVAICLAVHMGAKRIALIGVDFTDHHFFKKSGEHSLTKYLASINNELENLKNALEENDISIFNLSINSKIEAIKKIKYTDFFKPDKRIKSAVSLKKTYPNKINVLHIAKTNCAGAIWNLNSILNTYTNIQSRVITFANITNGIHYPQDVLFSETEKVLELIKNADIIHFHNWIDQNSIEMESYKELIKDKICLLQYHSEPALIQKAFKVDPVERNDIQTLVIAQKHVRFYPKSTVVPNLIDIYSSENQVTITKNEKLTILYTPTDTASYEDYNNTCKGKGYKETSQILKELESEGQIRAIIKTKLQKDDLLKLRQESDVIIDECVTGGFHLTSLEALSQGKVCIAYLDQEMRHFLTHFTNCKDSDLPWLNTKVHNLKQVLQMLVDNPTIVSFYKRYSREWMERFWNPKILGKRFEQIYAQSLLEKNQPLSTNIKRFNRIQSFEKPVNESSFNEIAYFINGKNFQHRSQDYPQKVFLSGQLLSQKNKHKNKAIHILGCGPSINDFDLSTLKDEIVISTNTSPLLFSKLGRASDYHCVSDRRFFERDNALELINLCNSAIKVFAAYCYDLINDPSINFVRIIGSKGMSKSIISGFYHSYSVVCFASQLALWLGARDIYLYGCEFDYSNGRFFNELNASPHDHTYSFIQEVMTELVSILNERNGKLIVVGKSRLTGGFGFRKLHGVESQLYSQVF
jgi:hypothetical protein